MSKCLTYLVLRLIRSSKVPKYPYLCQGVENSSPLALSSKVCCLTILKNNSKERQVFVARLILQFWKEGLRLIRCSKV